MGELDFGSWAIYTIMLCAIIFIFGGGFVTNIKKRR